MAMREVLCAHCMVPLSHTHKDDCPYLEAIMDSGIVARGNDRHTAHISEVEATIAQDHLRAAIKACYRVQDWHALTAIRAAMDVLKMKEDQ